jgi:hypothetical protein
MSLVKSETSHRTRFLFLNFNARRLLMVLATLSVNMNFENNLLQSLN